MGAFDVHNGPWGAFTDVIYVDLGKRRTQSRSFAIGNAAIPAGTTADLDLDIKAWVWTLAAEYRISDEPRLRVDVLAGTRYFDLRSKLTWSISGSLGPITPAGRTGSSEIGGPVWDAIIGVRGRVNFGADRRWSVTFYLDAGAGDSNYTWQGIAGIA
jgi:hypothetical protein